MTQTEALKLASRAINNLIASSHLTDPQPWRDARQDSVAALTAIKEALAQPEQEPVVWMTPAGEGFRIRFSPPVNDVPLGWDALYTTPPQRTWVGLSESDRRLINFQWQDGNGTATEIIDLVEAKLKEKNNGHN